MLTLIANQRVDESSLCLVLLDRGWLLVGTVRSTVLLAWIVAWTSTVSGRLPTIARRGENLAAVAAENAVGRTLEIKKRTQIEFESSSVEGGLTY